MTCDSKINLYVHVYVNPNNRNIYKFSKIKYRENICLNQTSLRSTFEFRIDRCSVSNNGTLFKVWSILLYSGLSLDRFY